MLRLPAGTRVRVLPDAHRGETQRYGAVVGPDEVYARCGGIPGNAISYVRLDGAACDELTAVDDCRIIVAHDSCATVRPRGQ